MQRILAVLAGITAAFLFTTEAHGAVYGGGGLLDGLQQAAGLGGISGDTSISDIILKIINFILNIILLVAVLVIIIAGVYLIVSNGDEANKEKAKNIIFYCIIGIIIILFSRLIVIVVNNIFG